MKIIGIHGKARSGKDELANILCSTYGFKKASFAAMVKAFGIKYFMLDPVTVYEKKTKQSRQILQGIGCAVRNCIKYIPQDVSFTDDEYIKVLGGKYLPNWLRDMAIHEFCIQIAEIGSRKKYIRTVIPAIYKMFMENYETFIAISGGILNNVWIGYLQESIGKQDSIFIIQDVRFKNEKKFIQDNGGKIIKITRIDNPKIEAGENHQSETDLNMDTDWDFVVLNEQRSDWQERLALSAANIVRKFIGCGFITENDKKNFKINVDEYRII